MNDFTPTLDRQNQILDLLSRQGRLSVSDIVETFSISEATARRDLEHLAGEGKLQRVHGGALACVQAPPEHPILQRESEQAEEKAAIGRAAAALVRDGETLFLGSGTTVLEVSRNFKHRRGLTVITNSLPVLNLLSGYPGIIVISLGGILRSSELSFIGHITEHALSELHADRVIIGVHAINLESGLTNDYLPETMTDRAILKAGREVIVVADHTKVNAVSTAFLAPVTSIHRFITDANTPDDFLAALKKRGLEVIKA